MHNEFEYWIQQITAYHLIYVFLKTQLFLCGCSRQSLEELCSRCLKIDFDSAFICDAETFIFKLVSGHIQFIQFLKNMECHDQCFSVRFSSVLLILWLKLKFRLNSQHPGSLTLKQAKKTNIFL